MNNRNDDTPKYRKKKDSSKSKIKNRANHKHDYIDAVFYTEGWIPMIGTYCKICGKVYTVKFLTGLDFSSKHREENLNNFCEKYGDLEFIELETVYPKYIPIKCGDKNV